MIIRIFKIKTKKLFVIKNKTDLLYFIQKEFGIILPNSMKIKNILNIFPVEEYFILNKEN